MGNGVPRRSQADCATAPISPPEKIRQAAASHLSGELASPILAMTRGGLAYGLWNARAKAPEGWGLPRISALVQYAPRKSLISGGIAASRDQNSIIWSGAFSTCPRFFPRNTSTRPHCRSVMAMIRISPRGGRACLTLRR